MKLGEKLRTLRKARRLTQEALAEYMQVSPQAVSKWETGVSCPDIEMLPRLAAFFHITTDELLDYDRQRLNEEVRALVLQSVPLRRDPAAAEAFYREALRRYPNNEVLLNCLLMVIPMERSEERVRLGERLLECAEDQEIRCDALRLLAQTYHRMGETAMAERCLAQLPGLYFLKCELAAALRRGSEQLEAIRTTETVCLGTLVSMLALRAERADGGDRCLDQARALLRLVRDFDGQRECADRLAEQLEAGTVLEFYRR